MIALEGLGAIAGRYRGFIVDLWGVLHDGVAPFAPAMACLAALRTDGARIVLLSNAPRRAAAAAAALDALGIERSLYDGIVTSGELTWQILRDREPGWARSLGRDLYHLGPERDRSIFEGLGLVERAAPANASFVLNTGPDDERNPTDPSAFDDVLADCLAAGLPMLCANPDLVVLRGTEIIICAGTLAERYRARGGVVWMVGKPDRAIYAMARAALGPGPEKILAIGDSLRTDIAGAAACGIDSLWVLGGIHRVADMAAADAMAAAAGLAPIAAMPALRW